MRSGAGLTVRLCGPVGGRGLPVTAARRIVRPAGAKKVDELVDVARAQYVPEGRHPVATMQNLSPDLRGSPAQAYRAQIGSACSTHAGDAVATRAAFRLERHRATLLGCSGRPARRWRTEEQTGKQREPHTRLARARGNSVHPQQILPDARRVCESARVDVRVRDRQEAASLTGSSTRSSTIQGISPERKRTVCPEEIR